MNVYEYSVAETVKDERSCVVRAARCVAAISHISDSLLLVVEGSYELSAYYQRRTGQPLL